MTAPNITHIANSKQKANNKEFKVKTYEKASLSKSPTDLYVIKLNFAIEIKLRIDTRQLS